MKTNTQSSLAEGLVILHLSDLHFGNKNRFQNHDLTAFGQEFSRAVRAACEEQTWSRPVDLVVVSGDISEVAKPKEFAACCTFLKTVVQGLNLNPERTIFVPGNHDFSWAECEIVDALRKIEEFDDAEYERRLTEVKFKHFDKFLQNFYGLTVAQIAGRTLLHAPSGAYLRNFVIDGLRVSFAALNTSEKETHKRFGGELSKEQAQPLINAWMGDVYQDHLKIAVVHHNPLATPPQNLQWTEEWLNGKIAANKLEVTTDWLQHYTADMAGFKGAHFLEKIVHDTGAHLVLHGHHHNPATPKIWTSGADGFAPVLSVGSFGLNADQIPTEQPLTCQLIFFRCLPEPRLLAVPLEFDPNYAPPGTLNEGQFRLNEKSKSVYNRAFSLPPGWIPQAKPATEKLATAAGAPPQVSGFVATYRARLSAAYSSYDLKNLGVLPAEMHKTINPQLDDMYLPLRFDEKFDINETGRGEVLDTDALIELLTIEPEKQRGEREGKGVQAAPVASQPVRGKSLAITGAAGAGKTTWMRHTFRRMNEDERFLPFLIELRPVANFWSSSKDPEGNLFWNIGYNIGINILMLKYLWGKSSKDQRTIEDYLEFRLREEVPAYQNAGVKFAALLDESAPWWPVLLVDGWDELGEWGAGFREKLLGMLKEHPRLLAITSSRPYGSGRPSLSDGFLQLQVQPLNPPEIKSFALKFNQKCYGEDEEAARKQAQAFAWALDRSTDAKVLAKTPLFLTMMLFINRSKQLPDKRHQFYEEWLKSLLSERPEMQMGKGAQSQTGEWCLPGRDSLRLQIVARLAHDLQTRHGKEDFASPAAIIMPKATLGGYLPQEWEDRSKDGFLLWLCSRAGVMVMVDDTQGSMSFAHLSFQEFLTAWHLNNNRVGDYAKSDFLRLAERPLWWETLLLWAALLNDQSCKRAEELLQSLLDNDHTLLARRMLDYGIGTKGQMASCREKEGEKGQTNLSPSQETR